MKAFQQAVSLHAQGRLWEAGQFCEIALKSDERYFDAIYRLGLIRLQQGKFSDAVPLFHRAVKIDKNSIDAQFHLAVALTGVGRFEEAIARYEKVLWLRPRFAEVHNNLGHTLQMLARHEEAAAHYEKALAINPVYAEAHNNLGNALQMLERSEEAIEQYQRALAIRANYPEAYYSLGNVLASLGRPQEAVAQYAKALALRPEYAEAHHSLGNALGALGRHDEAVAHYEQAIAIDPRHVEAYNKLGNLLLVLGRTDAALARCEEALSIQPNDVDAHNNIGVALRALGRLDEAIQAFERAIALAPRSTTGYLNLATSRRLTAGDPQFAAMQQLARDTACLDTGAQINLHFALGKVFDDLGESMQSSLHLMRGNALKRGQIQYDEAKTLERFERIRTVFTRKLMRDKARLGNPSSAPVFIIGMPRSGTTLVEHILASHPKVFGAGELQTVWKLAASISGRNGEEFPEVVPALSSEKLRELGATYLQEIERLAPGAERVTDKMPANFFQAGLIHLALPNGRIIHTRRDPCDTALSCFSILFAHGQDHTYDLAELGRYYRAYEMLMEHWRNVLPEGVMLEVRYEDVVGNLENQARRIVAHCGLEWDEACLGFHKTERSVRTASVTQVRQPIYRSSVGRWRAYEAMLQPFVQVLQGS